MTFSFDVPGTYIQEDTFGAIPAGLASFNRVYMLGYSNQAGSPKGTPTLVQSAADFVNVFGTASKSYDAVKLFFSQRSGAGLHFVNVAAAAAYPTLAEIVNAIENSFDQDMPQGFLIAPEFFMELTNAADRSALASAMEGLAADPGYNWFAIADCSKGAATATTITNSISLAKSERQSLSSPKGHMAFYYPYWVDASDKQVPGSAVAAGVALRRFRQQGYSQPPAGSQFPVYGVKGLTQNVTHKVQAELNPLGINCGRKLPAGRGTVIYGARTVSTNPYYKFMTTRIIMNVLDGSLLRAFDDFIFTTVDGFGELFGRIKGTATGICERLRRAGALFGATPEEAYRVVCDQTNNLPEALEQGQVTVDVIVKPSPMLEVLVARVSRASLGTTLTEVVQTADLDAVDTQQQA